MSENAPARGCLVGMAISLPIWAFGAWLAMKVW